MAITIVQQLATNTGHTVMLTWTTASGDWASNHTAGNTILLAVMTSTQNPTNPLVTAVSDSALNSYTGDCVSSGQGLSGEKYMSVSIWRLDNIAGGTKPTITITVANDCDILVTAFEVSGLANPSLDAVSQNQDLTFQATMAPTAGTVTASATSDLAVAACVVGTGFTVTWTAPSSYTDKANAGGGGIGAGGDCAIKIGTPLGMSTPTWGIDFASSYCAVVAAYKVPGALPQSLEPTLLTRTHTLFAPKVIQGQVLGPDALFRSPSVLGPSIRQGQVLGPALLTRSPSLASPAVLLGQVLHPLKLSRSPTLSPPRILQRQLLTTSRISRSPTLHGPAVLPGRILGPTVYSHPAITVFPANPFVGTPSLLGPSAVVVVPVVPAPGAGGIVPPDCWRMYYSATAGRWLLDGGAGFVVYGLSKPFKCHGKNSFDVLISKKTSQPVPASVDVVPYTDARCDCPNAPGFPTLYRVPTLFAPSIFEGLPGCFGLGGGGEFCVSFCHGTGQGQCLNGLQVTLPWNPPPTAHWYNLLANLYLPPFPPFVTQVYFSLCCLGAPPVTWTARIGSFDCGGFQANIIIPPPNFRLEFWGIPTPNMGCPDFPSEVSSGTIDAVVTLGACGSPLSPLLGPAISPLTRSPAGSPQPADLVAERGPSVQPQATGLCLHLGGPTGRVEECSTCSGRVRLRVMGCQVHGSCTVARPVPGISCCATCPDYLPAGPLPESM